MRADEDAYGRLVLDYLEGKPRVREIVERDDGFLQASEGPLTYFEPLRRWPPPERRALRLARGRVLDVGCGAGRVSLELQKRGREVVGIDVSPLAVEVSRRRGVRDARVVPFEEVDASLGVFDTVVMFGNNFGLFGNAAGARRLLRRLHGLTSERGRILGASNDPSATDDPAHQAYQANNRKRGRLPGELRLRVRYRELTTPWFRYLIATPEEMRELTEGTGWTLARLIQDEGSSLYVGVLEKEKPARTGGT
jgi:SAM-dependent methyltransferase